MIIGKRRGKIVYFPEITDFPNADSLAPAARAELEARLNADIEAYYRYRRFIMILMARKAKADKKAAEAKAKKKAAKAA